MALKRATTSFQFGGYHITLGELYDSTHVAVVKFPANFGDVDDVDLGDAFSVTGKASLSNFSFGAHEIATLVDNVATITKSHVWLAAESGTADQLDTLTKADAADGDLVLLVADTGDTITVDDANIDLGAATRAIGPGGSMIVRYDGTSWAEVTFLAGADNT